MLSFSFFKERLPTIPACPLGISANTLNQVNQFKYLGITFTPDLSWLAHINMHHLLKD